MLNHTKEIHRTYHEAVLSIGVLKAEFVEVDDCCVECSDWSVDRCISLSSSLAAFVSALDSFS